MTAHSFAFSTVFFPLACRRVLCVFGFVLLTSSCASDNPSSVDMTGRSQIEEDEVLLVGKVSVVPVPATKTSQETDTLNLFSDERVLLWLSPFKRNVKSQPDDMLGLSAAWGKTFSYAIPKKNVALQKLERAKAVNGELVYLPLLLPEAFKFLIRVDDRVVYIGHLRLYVNPFEEVIGFEVLDESKQAQHQLHQAIAENGRFRVSLMAPVSEFH